MEVENRAGTCPHRTDIALNNQKLETVEAALNKVEKTLDRAGKSLNDKVDKLSDSLMGNGGAGVVTRLAVAEKDYSVHGGR
jgi:hypothetical protein